MDIIQDYSIQNLIINFSIEVKYQRKLYPYNDLNKAFEIAQFLK